MFCGLEFSGDLWFVMMKGFVVGMVVVVLLVLMMVFGMIMCVELMWLFNVGDRGIVEVEFFYFVNVDLVVGMEGGGKKGVVFYVWWNVLLFNLKVGDDVVDLIWDVEVELLFG